MAKLKFYTLDVFSKNLFGGNPLAIFLEADKLSQRQMQYIAAELNYSETVFILKPDNIENSAKVKIFTPKNNVISNEWYSYNLKEIEEYLDIKINQKYFIKKMSDSEEAFLIPSELTPTFRNNHLQYAITWFVMSFAFFVLFLFYLKKNK